MSTSGKHRRLRGTKAVRKAAPTVVGWPLRLILFFVVIGLAAFLVALSVFPAFAGIAAVTQRVQDRLLAEADRANYRIAFPETSSIYTGDGKLLTTVDAGENRTYVKLDKIAKVAQDAVLAIEDDDFYEHGAIDAQAILRAAITNLGANEVVQGGSTITQQLVKNAIIGSSEQTFERKFQEAALAMRLEQEHDKEWIFERYLNQVYMANGVYGIGTAAQYYFDKPASKLNLAESALLAGIIRNPAEYDPVRHEKAARARRNVVIDRMSQLGWVTQAEATKAKKSKIKLTITRQRERTKPFIVGYVYEELVDPDNDEFDKILGRTREERELTLGTGGFRVYTTLRPDWISDAQEAAARNLGLRSERQAAIATVEVGDGAVLTVMSGQNYEREERNLVVAREVDGVWQGVRQPGSAFKPFTLVAAFEQKIPPETRFSSASPFRDKDWDSPCHCVNNAEGEGAGGMMNLWDATKYSINVVFAQLALKVGPEHIAKAARKMGITTPLSDVPSITLGSEEASPLDMASAYATLANDGTYCEPYVVTKIEDAKGNRIYRHKPDCKEVIDPDIARTVTQMLTGVVESGTGTAANIAGEDVAGKTGTSQDSADLWFVGYTPELSTAVWVGHPKGRVPMDGYGGTVAAPIWNAYMQRILRDVGGGGGFKEPENKIKSGQQVPDVVGMKKKPAVELLEKKLFTVQVNEVDVDEKKGVVVAQSPRAGSRADTGSEITIDVSTGAPKEVPSVVGMIEYEAKRILQEAGYDVSVTDVPVSKKRENRIVQAQTPRGGAEAKEGTTVTIEVGNFEK